VKDRRPAALLPPAVARLLAYVLLAGVAALQWARQVEHATTARALVWVATGAAAGIAVWLAGRVRGRVRGPAAAWGAALGGLVLAVVASGLDATYLQPARWDDLGDGLVRGAQALNSVHLPYIGRDPWVLATVELSGALLCALAAVLVAWPRARSGHVMASLAVLLVLAASPVVSLGTPHPVVLGLALAVLTACFFWLERVPGRPGHGLAILGAVAMLAAIPLGSAADREEPWFDYKAFAEGLGASDPVAFDWDHDYGPIDWPREGVELFRVRQTGKPAPMYWKADVLNDFDDGSWSDGSRTGAGGERPADDLPQEWRDHRSWNTQFQVSISRLRTPRVVGAGTVLAVTDPSRPVQPDVTPGLWITQAGRLLGQGDSYSVRAHVPRPTPAQLAGATVDRDERRASLLTLRVDFRADALERVPRTPPAPSRPTGRPLRRAEVHFPAYGRDAAPTAGYTTIGTEGDGDFAMKASVLDRTWALSQQLRRRAASPYDYVLRVNNYLRDPRFVYSEAPPAAGLETPLEFFLFDSREGYCQHYSGAMALLLRMGGIPARVVTGFSPGGLRRSSGEWIVRDTDAHSWVEAWFDEFGWVTFDPTPPDTPARSQVAAIAPPRRQASATPTPRPEEALARRPEGLSRDPAPQPTSTPASEADGGAPVPWLVVGGLGAVLIAALVARTVARRRRPAGPLSTDLALAELQRALRRSGREAPPGMTLSQLERFLGPSAEGAAYLRALRAVRYRDGARPPTRAERAAFRRDLASGLGWTGRMRSLWALPPALRLRSSRPR
jgi:transglutaminase-like putative cysteine protease